MSHDYYSDAPDASPDSSPPMEEEAKEKMEGTETALIPQSLCPGMKPGDELVLKIDRVHGEEYEVSYAPKEESPEEAPPESAPPSGDPQMASMME